MGSGLSAKRQVFLSCCDESPILIALATNVCWVFQGSLCIFAWKQRRRLANGVAGGQAAPA